MVHSFLNKCYLWRWVRWWVTTRGNIPHQCTVCGIIIQMKWAGFTRSTKWSQTVIWESWHEKQIQLVHTAFQKLTTVCYVEVNTQSTVKQYGEFPSGLWWNGPESQRQRPFHLVCAVTQTRWMSVSASEKVVLCVSGLDSRISAAAALMINLNRFTDGKKKRFARRMDPQLLSWSTEVKGRTTAAGV